MARKSSLEASRIIAFLMIVCIHASSTYISNNHYVGELNWQFANFLDGFGRIGPAIFVLITGYGMCNSQTGVRKRLKSLLIPLPFFLLPTFVHYALDGYSPLATLWMFLRNLLTLGVWFYHLWYVFIILIIYIISPWLNRFIQPLSKQECLRVTILLFVLFSAIPSINFFLTYTLLPDTLYATKFGAFIMYYFIGAYMRLHADLSRFSGLAKFSAFLVLNIAVVFMSTWYNSRFSPVFALSAVFNVTAAPAYPLAVFVSPSFDISSILCVLSAAAFFIWILSFNFNSMLVNAVARLTYGAYIIHVFWLNTLLSVIGKSLDSLGYPLKIIFLIAAAFVLSILSSYVLNTVGKGILNYRRRYHQKAGQTEILTAEEKESNSYADTY